MTVSYRIIAEAKKDNRVITLFEEVKKVISIRFQKAKNDSWGAYLSSRKTSRKKIGTILFCKSKHPAACLAHELLHLSLQIRGFKKYILALSSSDIEYLLYPLDNELQHHKMYKQFSQLGFQPNEFYGEDDKSTEGRLIQSLNRPISSIKDILLDFLTLIAPGGSISDERKNELITKFKKKANSAYSKQLNEIKNIFTDWAESQTLDSEQYLRRFFLVLENPTNIWLGFGSKNEFLKNGFFVDKKFRNLDR